MFVYSSLLSFQTPHSLPCVCSTLLIVCSSPIVYTCSSSSSVFSLCVFLCLVASSSLFPRVSSVPAISMIITFLVIPTLACVIDSALCFCFIPVCTSACSTIVYPCTEPGLDLQRTLLLPDTHWDCVFVIGLPYLCTEPGLDLLRPLPLPDSYWNCVFVIGLPLRVPKPFSKSYSLSFLSPSRAFESNTSERCMLHICANERCMLHRCSNERLHLCQFCNKKCRAKSVPTVHGLP